MRCRLEYYDDKEGWTKIADFSDAEKEAVEATAKRMTAALKNPPKFRVAEIDAEKDTP